MVGSSGSGGDDSFGRSSSMRSKKLKELHARKSLRNCRQQSSSSLHERLSQRNSTGSSQGRISATSGQSSVYFKTIREASGAGGGPVSPPPIISVDTRSLDARSISFHRGRTVDSNLPSNVIEAGGSKASKDLRSSKTSLQRCTSNIDSITISKTVEKDSYQPPKFKFPSIFKSKDSQSRIETSDNNKSIELGEYRAAVDTINRVEEYPSPLPSPTHDIYCCSNVASNTLSATKKNEARLQQTCCYYSGSNNLSSSNLDSSNLSNRISSSSQACIHKQTSRSRGLFRMSDCCGVRYYHKNSTLDDLIPPPQVS